MNFKIKIVFDFDEQEYVVYAEGITTVEGRGFTEQEAIDNFYENLKK